jgi:heat shock protein HslJ
MRRRYRTAYVLGVALAAALMVLLASGAGACGGDDPAVLDGTNWKLAEWSDSALDPGDFTITADFEDGRVGGIAVVNNYGGPYETGPGDEFSVGPLSSTMMGASGDDARAEKIFFSLLDTVKTYSHEDDTLTLYDADGVEALVFDRVTGS